MAKTAAFAIVWARAPKEGCFEVHHGRWADGKITHGKGRLTGNRFAFAPAGAARLTGRVTGANLKVGPRGTRVCVTTVEAAFTFFLRDVHARTPILLPQWGVAVTSAGDRRDYAAIDHAVRAKGLVSELQRIEAAPEETYENACAANRDQIVPLWLGLSRDMRIFHLTYHASLGYFGNVQPCYHYVGQAVPETDQKTYTISYVLGRGAGCRVDIQRRLEQGALPILHAVQRDGDVSYNVTAFVTLEKGPLGRGRLRGTHWLALYANSAGNMLTSQERSAYEDDLREFELHKREEETVCCIRVEVVNEAAVPRYAFFKGLHGVPGKVHYDARHGFARFESGRVWGIQSLNGAPLPAEELAILLQPGQKARFEMIIPHQPLSPARAARLARMKVDEHLEACRAHWLTKLASAAQVSLPEQAIDERLHAGLLHLDVVAYGLEPKGPIAATIGVYSPIGSESSPIIQFMDSMGWHNLARRAIQFFFERQRADGFIQTFGGYQLETGPVLWTAGEHYRYTRDDRWVRSVRTNVLKACDYIMAWRNRNKREELRGQGYGLLDGKVADPEDFFHSYMLNALSCVGIARAAEMLANVDPANARRLAREAREFRHDIRSDYAASVARSPLIPTGDGTWVPSAPPWSEYPGPVALFAEGGNWFTHGAIGARDSLIGPTYLVLAEVLDAHEPLTEFLLKQHQEINTLRNAGFSQPYYCRHDYVHALRGEVKPFLKTYYNQVTGLQDRQSYTFWEHYFYASPHKTHEEGWFLMQTRWMLYHEQGRVLKLLPLIPRRWLDDGEQIRIDGMVSHFGPFTLEVDSQIGQGRVTARVVCDTNRPPADVILRLPHPIGLKAAAVHGGSYDPYSESVRIRPFRKEARIVVRF